MQAKKCGSRYANIPDTTVGFIDEKEAFVNALGVKSIGEVAVVGAMAAVGNAVFRAIAQ